ncbi:MAG: ABC transporter ATP-binding protein [Firmicutes bacterium]|jgi:NitT/TauT family transport system ATP-binding protein|nr:ABC transporter ATP-binding protein [Bacillota bacterium]NLL89340.1 ABC transporter ATP-binding protein [Bacillota bacterium]HKM18380.1 ABC transporter ATP-binding protein [Limnochordia bacterium]
MAKLLINNVSLKYHTIEDEIEALREFNLKVTAEEFIGIVGPSGCGKSTLLSLIAGLIKPTTGSIILDGTPISGTTQKIGYMLQQDYLFEWRTILDNALLGLEVMHRKTPDSIARVKQMLKDYGLSGFENSYPHQLSGGMRQRVALIRTLATEPDLLLLDEPFSALDYQTRLAVGEDVCRILCQHRKTVIMVTHDIAEAISMADRVIVMTPRPGRVKSEHVIDFGPEYSHGSPLKRRESPKFREYFAAIWKELNSNEQ